MLVPRIIFTSYRYSVHVCWVKTSIPPLPGAYPSCYHYHLLLPQPHLHPTIPLLLSEFWISLSGTKTTINWAPFASIPCFSFSQRDLGSSTHLKFQRLHCFWHIPVLYADKPIRLQFSNLLEQQLVYIIPFLE